jgi:hypothetical protein
MLAIGCLLPIVFLAVGAVAGAFFGGVRGGTWGTGIGFAVGCVALIGLLAVLGRIKRS